MYCVVSSCNSLLQEVREWYAVVGVKKSSVILQPLRACHYTCEWGEWKSQTPECRERIAWGKKFPHLLPSPFTLLGSCIRLRYCHYPWNCLLAATIMYAGVHPCSEARQWTWSHSVYWTVLCFLAGSESPLAYWFEEILAACTLKCNSHTIPHKQISSISSGSGQKQRRKAVQFWWHLVPSTDSPSSCRGSFVLKSKTGSHGLKVMGIQHHPFPMGSQFHKRQYLLGILKASCRELYFYGSKQHQEQPDASMQVTES